jgi:hypothetical protein
MNDLGSIKITDVAVNVGGLQVLHDVNISARRGTYWLCSAQTVLARQLSCAPCSAW